MRVFVCVAILLFVGLVSMWLSRDDSITASITERHETVIETPSEVKEYTTDDAVTDALNEQLEAVASHFKQSLRYPDYSTLLTPDAAVFDQTNVGSTIERPYDLNGLKGEVTLSVDHFFYTQNTAVTGKVHITGDDGFMDLVQDVSIVIDEPHQHGQKTGTLLNFNRYNNAPIAFDIPSPTQGAGEYIVATIVNLYGGEQLFQSSVIEVSGAPVAELSNVSNGIIENNELHIPFAFSYEKEGYYRVSAKLFSQDDQPIASLQESFFTDDALPTRFRVSGLLLRDLKVNPPYVLRDIHIEHIPAEASAKVGKGISSQPEYTVDADVEYDQFLAVPTQLSAQSQLRLEFMETIAN